MVTTMWHKAEHKKMTFTLRSKVQFPICHYNKEWWKFSQTNQN